MFVKSVTRMTFSALAIATLVSLSPHAFAAPNFDGTWVVDVQAADPISQTSDSVCPALRFPVQIKDSQVTGTLTRVPSRDGVMIVEAGKGTDSGPVTGTVQADGTVNAQGSVTMSAASSMATAAKSP